MKILVLGDIHSNLVNLKNAFEKVKDRDIGHLIVLGDLQSLEVIDIIGTTNYKTSIIFGNADFDRNAFLSKAQKYKNIEAFDDNRGKIEIEGVKIAFCHYPQTAKKIAREEDVDVVFSGHWHSPHEEKINGTLSIRPGEVAGQIYEPAFCIFDTKNMKPELILINR